MVVVGPAVYLSLSLIVNSTDHQDETGKMMQSEREREGQNKNENKQTKNNNKNNNQQLCENNRNVRAAT